MNSQIELDSFMATIYQEDTVTASATHKILAYHYVDNSNDVQFAANDDGEICAGERLLDIL